MRVWGLSLRRVEGMWSGSSERHRLRYLRSSFVRPAAHVHPPNRRSTYACRARPAMADEPLAPGGRCDAGGVGGANVQHIGRAGRAGRALFCEMNTSRQLRAMNTTRSPGKRGSM